MRKERRFPEQSETAAFCNRRPIPVFDLLTIEHGRYLHGGRERIIPFHVFDQSDLDCALHHSRAAGEKL